MYLTKKVHTIARQKTYFQLQFLKAGKNIIFSMLCSNNENIRH